MIEQNFRKLLIAALALFLGIASMQVLAQLQISFVESAPRDRFEVVNTGECELNDFQLVIDLRQSRGSLLFDTTGSGAGVEVFQPFEVAEGLDNLSLNGMVSDGDRLISVQVRQLLPGVSISFTIDVDDTNTESELGQIRVTGSEIEGATASASDESGSFAVSARFNAESRAVLALSNCKESNP